MSQIGFPIPPQAIEIPEFWNFIFLSGVITEDVAIDVCSRLLSINMINLSNKTNEPIQIFINSPGGDLAAAWQICDLMDFIPTPIHTVGLGQVASAGFIILMNGDERRITDRTSIMTHSYSWGGEGPHDQLIAKTKEFNHTYNRLITHYKECTGLDEEIIKKDFLSSTDRWMSAKEAKKYGFIDQIVRSNKTKKIEERKKKANGNNRPKRNKS